MTSSRYSYGWSDLRGIYEEKPMVTLKHQMYDTMLGEKFAKKLSLDNLIEMAHIMDDFAFKPDEREPKRRRLSKQLAETLIDAWGDHAHFKALEELEKNPNNQLWRDTLSWLDELTKQKGK